MSKVTPFITFDGRGAEAVKLYTSLIKNSKIHNMEQWGPGGPVKEGSLINATFELDGQPFMAMDVDGGFAHGEGFSIYVECTDQAEVDLLWEKLSEGGEQQPCGWLKDKYGISWQIIPSALPELLGKAEGKKKQAVLGAMLKMKKIIVADLDEAYQKAS
jgi:predicted 3-demethylubiquinone-9 3-methyltransferase (glyoxalase superfamily)